MCETAYHFCTCRFDPKGCRAIAHPIKCVCLYSADCRAKVHTCVCVTPEGYLGLGDRCKSTQHACVCRILSNIKYVNSLKCSCWSLMTTSKCNSSLHQCSCFYDKDECRSTYHVDVCEIIKSARCKDVSKWKHDKYNCCVKVGEN